MTEFVCDVTVNAIVWINALSEQDFGISSRVFEDVEAQAQRHNYIYEQHTVANKQDLKCLLEDLTNRAKTESLRPILHFDAHGCEEKGLHIAGSNEFLAWDELHQEMRCLNAATNSNLVCILALCHGIKAFEGVDVNKPAPAILFAAPEKEVQAGFLADETRKFYEKVMEASDLAAAFDSTLGKELRLIHSVRLLFMAIVSYVKANCSNRKRQERADMLVNDTADMKGGVLSTEEMRALRAEAKLLLKPDQSVVDKFSGKFLVGRQPPFTFKDIEEVANQLC